jgi:hypothetical protein
MDGVKIFRTNIMNADIFSEWLRRQGHKVYQTESSYWYDAGPKVLQAFPYHWTINPGKDELHELMLRNHILSLRYSSPVNSDMGRLSYHIVQDSCYNLGMLNSKARNGVKKGLECFKVENITFDRLAREGWHLQEDTIIRQNRRGSMGKKEWERLCLAARDLPGFEVFAALSGNDLAAAVIVFRMENTYTVPFAMSHCSFLRNHVNNALFYAMSCELLKRENISGIFFTVQSLDAPSNVDEFKLRMGFEPKLVRQNVLIHPYLRPLITKPVHAFVDRLHKRYPSSNYFAKAEGMMRFYLEGRYPLDQQSLPDLLKRDIILPQAVQVYESLKLSYEYEKRTQRIKSVL